MAQKRLMLLGGIRYLLPVIKAAHEQGYYVITADYLPDNYAHKFSDEYVNVSIIDSEAVLKAAKERNIDGIMSFGVDPGVVAASYVQNLLGLPSFGPFESVAILQNKDKFRAFLKENGFNVPNARGFGSIEEAMEDLGWYEFPVMVKPIDSAGSKGVSKVDDLKDLRSALEKAFVQSIKGRVIVEQFIRQRGCASDCDCYSEDGVLRFVSFNSQHFDENAANPYTPAAFSWPSTFSMEEERCLTSEIQRLISLLGMRTCVYNVETRVGLDGKPYIMEVSPRGGGNRLSEMVRYVYGVDLITPIVRYCVGDKPGEIIQSSYSEGWAEIILHSDKRGFFDSVDLYEGNNVQIIEKDIWVKRGDCVQSFNGANNSVGTIVVKFYDGISLQQFAASVRINLK